jgi:hypothetical protein
MGTNVVISWPQTCNTYTLEQTGALPAPPAAWSPVGVAPTGTSGHWTVTLPIWSTNAFFRLKSP